MDNRMGKAETNLAKVGDVSDKFPLTESDIAAFLLPHISE